jgi:predicted regulator of Ras-like GTPase activity (Roadblock/LC7/MglB family)
MTSKYQDEIRALRDIKGVFGAFVLNDSGEVCLNDMPSVLTLNELSAIGPRICRIVDSLTKHPPVESFTIRFVEHRLTVRPLQDGSFLCVLSDAQTNQPALRMATTLASRKLQGFDFGPITPRTPPKDETEKRETLPSVPPASSGRLMYRGRPVSS